MQQKLDTVGAGEYVGAGIGSVVGAKDTSLHQKAELMHSVHIVSESQGDPSIKDDCIVWV